MAAQKDTDRTAATAAAIDGTALWVIVNNAGASVKMTLAQLKTNYNAVTSMTGDVSASIAAGVATTTIAASSVATAMIQNLAVSTAKIAADAVTYEKIQDMTTGRLLGRTTASTGIVEELSVTSNLTLSGGSLDIAASVLASISAPVDITGDITTSSGSFADATGLLLAVSANTSYFFEFLILWETVTGTNDGPAFAVTAPSSPTFLGTRTEIHVPSTWQTTEWGTGNDATATGVVSVAVADTTYWARVSGTLRNGANAGNVQLRYKSTQSTNAIKIKAGSFGRLTAL